MLLSLQVVIRGEGPNKSNGLLFESLQADMATEVADGPLYLPGLRPGIGGQSDIIELFEVSFDDVRTANPPPPPPRPRAAVAANLEAVHAEFARLIDSGFRDAAIWLSQRPLDRLDACRAQGVAADVYVWAIIDDNMMDLDDIPHEFLAECGRLGLSVTIHTHVGD